MSLATPVVRRREAASAVSPKITSSVAASEQVTDADWLSRCPFTNALSKATRAAALQEDVSGFIRSWRKERVAEPASRGLPIWWSRWSVDSDDELSVVGGELLAMQPSEVAQSLVKQPLPQSWTVPNLFLALEIIARHSKQVSPEVLISLLRRTHDFCTSHWQNATESEALSREQRLLSEGELPFVAGVLLQGFPGSRDWLKRGRKFLTRELMQQTDTDGSPHARLLPQLSAWLAPFVRATLIAKSADVSLWNDEQAERFSDLVKQAIALCPKDGKVALANPDAEESPGPLAAVLAAAAAGANIHSSGLAASYLKSVVQQLSSKTKSHAKKKPSARRKLAVADSSASNQSDWSQYAIMRSDWSLEADTVAVTHHQSLPSLDFRGSGEPILKGAWGLEVQVGDAELELAHEWPCSCWSSDPDGDYLELQMAGPKGLHLERFVMLSRTDRFAILADVLRGAKASPLELVSRLPLAVGISASVEPGTRSVLLKDGSGKTVARVAPLAMPQSGLEGTSHSVSVTDKEVIIRYRSHGRGQFLPMVIDWHPDRRKTTSVWRSLTVSELGHPVSSDLAAGFRYKSGGLQVLIYRSLKAGRTARAVLGYHTFHETAICRMDKQGDVEPILIVD